MTGSYDLEQNINKLRKFVCPVKDMVELISPLSSKRRKRLHIDHYVGLYSFDETQEKLVATDVPEY